MARDSRPVCDVCERSKAPWDKHRVFICSTCAHPDRVRTYCLRCHARLDLSLESAHDLFAKANMNIYRTGIVIRFVRCASCVQTGETIDIDHTFVIDQPSSSFAAAHA